MKKIFFGIFFCFFSISHIYAYDVYFPGLSEAEILRQGEQILDTYIQKYRPDISKEQRKDWDFLWEEILQKEYDNQRFDERERGIFREYIFAIIPDGVLLRVDQTPLWHGKNEYNKNIIQQGKKIIDAYIQKYNLIKTETENSSSDFLKEVFTELVRNNSEEDISIFDEYIQLVTTIPLHELYKNPRYAYLKNHGITTEELIAESEVNEKSVQKPSKGNDGFEKSTSATRREAARLYAYNRAFTRNNFYDYYEHKRDCTDFISQALYDGLFLYIGIQSWWNRENINYWYYNSNKFPGPTHTWGGANNFYQHAGVSSRYSPTNLSNLQVGDIIQVDWRKANGTAPDGDIDHTMMVTKKTGNTIHDIYLSYHNHWDYPNGNGPNYPPDARNKKLSEVIGNSLPSSHMWYMWKVHY